MRCGTDNRSTSQQYYSGLVSRATDVHQRAIALLAKALPHDLDKHETFARQAQLDPHIAAAADRDPGDNFPGVWSLLARLGRSRRERGLFDKAVDIFEPLLARMQVVFGPEDPSTRLVQRGAVAPLVHQGNFDRAQKLLGELLAGTADSALEVLETRHALASLLVTAGRYKEGLLSLEQLVPELLAALGENDETTLAARTSQATAYWGLKCYGKAISIQTDVLERHVELFGEHRRSTFLLRVNLASTYFAAGEFQHAVEVGEELVEEAAGSLGDIHPLTLSARHNLATAYWKVGKRSKGKEMMSAVVSQFELSLGLTHHQTIEARASLGTMQ